MKSIETEYKGCRFRSRTEARWAVFFDAAGIEWQYEAEGFEMSDGTRYLPDFYLPTFSGGMYVEVKAPGGDFVKARRFAEEAPCCVWLADGPPALRAYECSALFGGDGPGDPLTIGWFNGIPNADQAETENRMFWEPGYEAGNGTIPEGCQGMLGKTFTNAVLVARSSRFEFGERGPKRRRGGVA